MRIRPLVELPSTEIPARKTTDKPFKIVLIGESGTVAKEYVVCRL